MEVGRWYNVHSAFYTIARLWAQETVFSDQPSLAGRQDTLKRVTDLRDELNKVIAELTEELEEEAWLS